MTASAVAWALRSVTDPTIPANGGALRPVRLIIPAGIVVGATPPAAVGAGNVEVSQRVADVCLRALAPAGPGPGGRRRPGHHEQPDPRRPVRVGVLRDHRRAARAAGPGRPGMNGVHTAMTNTMDTPTEALERAYPVRVLRYRLREGSGGRGRAAGGDGIERVIQVLEPATVSLITERRVSTPWGLAGGGSGRARGELALAGRG